MSIRYTATRQDASFPLSAQSCFPGISGGSGGGMPLRLGAMDAGKEEAGGKGDRLDFMYYNT
jgi:hypothetical protein